VKMLLNVQGELSLDASDALGIAICHANYQQTAIMLGKQGVLR